MNSNIESGPVDFQTQDRNKRVHHKLKISDNPKEFYQEKNKTKITVSSALKQIKQRKH